MPDIAVLQMLPAEDFSGPQNVPISVTQVACCTTTTLTTFEQ